jgi:beta-N-acetylhexosaminidase
MKNLFIFLAIISLSFSAPDFSAVNQLVEDALQQSLFPGITIGVGSSKSVIWTKAFGFYQYKKDLFQTNVTLDTKWDLDRVTQIVSIVPTIMHLIEAGKLNLTDKITKYEFDFDNNNKKNLTI